MKKLIAGNWKMNMDASGAARLVLDILTGIDMNAELQQTCDFAIFPSYVHLPPINMMIKEGEATLILGAQDCSHVAGSGAYTGDISTDMLVNYGCTHVILGHSERRQYHNESDELINQKAQAAHKNGLVTIICVGETIEQREAGKEQEIVKAQITNALPEGSSAHNTVIAYEPVWAIGSGQSASVEDVAVMHEFIRNTLKEQLADSENMRILYGGSMKPANAGELLSTPNVDGGLIGGASLKAEDFLAIGKAVLKEAELL